MKPIVAAILLAGLASPSVAGALVPNADWSFDVLDVAGDPTQNSSWTVTFTRGGTLRFLDCCIVGDIWTVSGDVAGVSSFYVGGPLRPVLTPHPEWFDSNYSKLEISGIAPGTYTFSITGDGAGGLPAGIYLSATDIPEAATWAMLITGFGLVGFAARRRQTALTA
jgi:hypothetical protein